MTASQFWRVARRARWIGTLVLALGVAAAFAALGQWQLERSVVVESTAPTADTEAVVPLDTIADPQTTITVEQFGRMVEVSGAFVPGDEVVLEGRLQDGTPGAWLVGHLVLDDGSSLAVAQGWAPDAAAARAAASQAGTPGAERYTGRYLVSESPTESDYRSGVRNALSVGELINVWDEVDTVYAGYLVLDEAPPGLTTIDAPPPVAETGVNWLNIFYAIEWVIFAGFALYLWYRLVRDVVEAEQEDAADAADGVAAGPGRAAARDDATVD
jgi:surfeit locus 1 family protein